jgi:hypothetical protein
MINEPVVLNFALLDNDYLYDTGFHDVLQDKEFLDLFQTKYARVIAKDISLSEEDISAFLIGRQPLPGNELSIDNEIYGNKLYFTNDNGLFVGSAHRDGKYPVSTRPKKIWDCRPLSIKANKYPQIAVCAGEEGLWELDLSGQSLYRDEDDEYSIHKLSDMNAVVANYAYLSVVGTSAVDPSIALFKWKTKEDQSTYRPFGKHFDYARQFKDVLSLRVSQDKSRREFTFGVDDKIYTCSDGELLIRKFENHAGATSKETSYLSDLARVSLPKSGPNPVSGGTCYFGTILEYLDSLVVLQSDGEHYTVPEKVVRWRTFNRSQNYQNQMHVILSDRLEIYSFNNDYFIEQEKKLYGVEYRRKQDIQKRSLRFTL